MAQFDVEHEARAISEDMLNAVKAIYAQRKGSYLEAQSYEDMIPEKTQEATYSKAWELIEADEKEVTELSAEATAIITEATRSKTPWITLTTLLYDEPNSLKQVEKKAVFNVMEGLEQFRTVAKG